MKLSIVTSYYNSSKFIEQQSESILSQKYQNWEWIICDDFSSDDTKEKLIELASRDRRIRLVEPKFKKEIWWNPQTYASGDIVCPIDGDDAILPGAFDKIVHYFESFPEVILMHFNANKYQDSLPSSSRDMMENFVDNVYMSRDNVSFLDAFERLCPSRSCIFGYLRIFRNIPGIQFKVHENQTDCSSNDGQWLLTLEEHGKWLSIPRTTYLARQHWDSENFRNWNIRGEVINTSEASERRKDLKLEMPRSIDYYNEIYVAAESTYLSKLNWETHRKNINFLNYKYNETQKEKVRHLFYDHDIFFDSAIKCDYSFIRIDYDTNVDNLLQHFLKATGKINLFCDNIHLHSNNRTGKNTLDEIKEYLASKYYFYWNYQENRAIFYIHGVLDKVQEPPKKMLNTQGKDLASILQNAYENTDIKHQPKKETGNTCTVTYVDGPRVTIEGDKKSEYLVKFINTKTDTVLFETKIGTNSWCACSIKYLVYWKIEVYDGDILWKTFNFDPSNKKVYIHLDSSSLGDTLAWFPVVEEFRKQHNCQVTCSTFHNDFFLGNYPDIEFTNPGQNVENLYAKFGIGWYYNDSGNWDLYKNRRDFKTIPLQRTAHDILSMEYAEVKPKVFNKGNTRNTIGGKYVCIAPHASSLAKYWNRPGGWQEIINYLNSSGYKVVLISQEKHGDTWHDSKLGGMLEGVIDKSGDAPILERYQDLCHASAFIGLGSGLSWLSWAAGTPTILISGFSEDWTEFHDCQRISANSQCKGCFNKYRLDASDWWWCPVNKNTDKMFECSKSIEPSTVKEALRRIIPDLR